MRVITKKRLQDFWLRHPATKNELVLWHNLVAGAAWETPLDVKDAFGHRVDFVKTRSNHTLTVFDASNNRRRLITDIHYKRDYPLRGRVYILRVLTHKQYDSENWKDEL